SRRSDRADLRRVRAGRRARGQGRVPGRTSGRGVLAALPGLAGQLRADRVRAGPQGRRGTGAVERPAGLAVRADGARAPRRPPADGGASAVPVATPTPTPPEPSPAPTPTPSPTRSPVPPKPSPKRSPSPTSTFLGILTARDLSTFCTANHAGRVAQHSDRSWY